MSIVTIITHPPRTGGRSTQQTHEFDTKAAAIDFINSLPDEDQIPAGDGTSEK